MNPSNEPKNNNNKNNKNQNLEKMSTNDISNRLQTLQDRLKEPNNEMGGRRRPDNFGTPIGRRERLNGLGLSLTQMNRVESETDNKFKQIMKQSGILTINGIDFKTDIKDLDDLGELGNGTSGHVVKMKHKPTKTIIAVKQMRRTNNNEENKRITMDIEVVLKSHDCPFIVHCLGCFITDAEVWICMELMTTCFDKLLKKTKTPVPEPILGKITVATVKALSFLKNNHDVIHRDVKPSNILVDERGNIKLCDFGISGRLVDSKANTRSAGCAAYMAPERIDPKKKEYDIRADVWSLGITLVELATSTLPYKGCNTEFEVLTCILENNPPSLPTDQGFSLEFQTFVRKCLTKESGNRPKYAELLQSDFIKTYETADVDVASWLASVMQPKQQKNELHRSIADKNIMPQSSISISTTATVPAIVPTTAIAVTSNHLPVYQLTNNKFFSPTNDRCYNHTNNNVNISNGGTIESALNTNPFQLKSHILNTNENLNTVNNHQQQFKKPQHQPQHISDEDPMKELSLNRLTISNNLLNSNSNTNYHPSSHNHHHHHHQHHHQKTPSTVSNASSSATTQYTFNNVSNLSRTPSFTERDRISECPLPMMPTTNFPRKTISSPLAAHQQLQPDERYPIVKSPIPPISSARAAKDDEYVNVTTNQIINYEYPIPQSEHPIQMPYNDIKPCLIDEQPQQRRKSVSPQMLHFQQLEERMADELNELYKATMLMHAHQQQKIECQNQIDQIKPQYMPIESIYNNDPARHQLLQRNNSLSPYLQRKYSLQRPIDQNVNRWRTGPQYGRSISATASPNLDGRRQFQTAIPVLDDDRTQMVRLKGNTSPIVLQRFYHQQNQLRERGSNEQFYNGSSSHSQMQYTPDHEIYLQRDVPVVHMTKNESQTNPFMKHIPKLTQKLNPFKQQSPKRKEAIYANTNMLMNQKCYGHDQYDGDLMQRENIHLQRIPITPPMDIYNNYEKTYSNYKDHYPVAEYKNAYNEHGTPLKTSAKKSNGLNNNINHHRDDPGWFNSIASVVKRRFASYVKSHLGDGNNTKKDRDYSHYGQHQNPMQPSSPYHFEKLRPALQTASMASTSMPSSPHFGNRSNADHHHYERERLSALSPRMLNNVDRRHRSPDPPPRYNKGQSPLLLRRNLLEYGNNQVAPSPLLPRRYISASPPLPPPRKGSDSVPGSPQQLRARVHYTPELQRRIYRTIDQ